MDERTKMVHDYSKRKGVLGSKLILPSGAPMWARDRAVLWNAAEKAETRKNASVGREFEVSLPSDLPDGKRRALGLQLTLELVNTYGFVAEIFFHAPSLEDDGQSFGAHILCSTRMLGPDGFGEKTRVLDDRTSGPNELMRWRGRWAELQKAYLRAFGKEPLTCGRSLKDYSVIREPIRRLGKVLTHREQQLKQEAELQGLAGFRAWNLKFDGPDGGNERSHQLRIRIAIEALERREGIEQMLRARVERMHRQLKTLRARRQKG